MQACQQHSTLASSEKQCAKKRPSLLVLCPVMSKNLQPTNCCWQRRSTIAISITSGEGCLSCANDSKAISQGRYSDVRGRSYMYQHCVSLQGTKVFRTRPLIRGAARRSLSCAAAKSYTYTAVAALKQNAHTFCTITLRDSPLLDILAHFSTLFMVQPADSKLLLECAPPSRQG